MNFNLRALGLTCAAVVAIGAIGAVSASGETGGHFTVSSQPYRLKSSENATHFLEFAISGLTGFMCEPTTRSSEIYTETTFTLMWFTSENNKQCKTTGGKYGESVFHFNGCKINVLIGKKSTQDNTTELECPVGKQLEITHDGCVIRVPAQKGFSGVAYNTVIENGKHALTASFTAGGAAMTANFESGFCTVLGTKHTMAITGSLTIWAVDTVGAPIDLTATGSEG
jgi:hypothetical protein